MIFYTHDTKKIYELSARTWRDGSGYGPDFFAELETGVPSQFQHIDHIYICTQSDVEEIINYWELEFSSPDFNDNDEFFIKSWPASPEEIESIETAKLQT